MNAAELQTLVEAMPGFSRNGTHMVFTCPLDPSTDGTGHYVHYYLGDETVDCDQGHESRWVEQALVQVSRVADLHRGPPQCPEANALFHRPQSCPLCIDWTEWARRAARRRADQREEAEQARALADMWLTGDALFDRQQIEPIWGSEELGLLSAVGQAWMICAPNSVGKTSIASQYVKARIGLDGWAGEMWGLPVAPLEPGRRAAYLAMDRTRQIQESLARGLVEDAHRGQLRDRLRIHAGPPPYRLSGDAGQQWVLDKVGEFDAGLLVIDSRKDLGSTIDAEEVSGISRLVQLLSSMDVEVLILAHPNERRRNGPPTLSDISGFADVYNGLGSVLFVEGAPGDLVVEVHHLKPLRHEVMKPFKISHDKFSGRSERIEGIVPEAGTDNLVEGRMPADRWEVRVLAFIDAQPDGWAPSRPLAEYLHSGNLSRDLRTLVKAKVIESNGARGKQSAYRRGPNAPGTSDQRQ